MEYYSGSSSAPTIAPLTPLRADNGVNSELGEKMPAPAIESIPPAIDNSVDSPAVLSEAKAECKGKPGARPTEGEYKDNTDSVDSPAVLSEAKTECKGKPGAPPTEGEYKGNSDSPSCFHIPPAKENVPLSEEKHDATTGLRAASLDIASDEEGASPRVFAIKDLKPSTPSEWAFIARVIAKNPVRSWKTFQDSGKLMEAFVSDAPEAIIRVTLFDEAIDTYNSAIVPGATCVFSGGRIKRAFASTTTTIEVSFGSSAHIRPVNRELAVAPAILFTRFDELSSFPTGAPATTIGVVHALGSLKHLRSRKGKTVEKRELLLVDDSGSSLVCTIWERLAIDYTEIAEGTVVVVRAGNLSDYKGTRSISIGAGSDLIVDADIERASQLRHWYDTLPHNQGFSPVAV